MPQVLFTDEAWQFTIAVLNVKKLIYNTAILQRVHGASVSVDQKVVNQIGKGLLIFAGVGKNDTRKEAELLAAKVLKMRLWEGADGAKWKSSVQDIGGEILCVSQFTLYASTSKGNKPDFHKSASGPIARELYDHFFTKLCELHQPNMVKDGVFQAMMDVSLVNDGPVTVEIVAEPAKSVDLQGQVQVENDK